MISTYVSANGGNLYPARVDPTNRWNGLVSPLFTLDTVRELAADTQKTAAEHVHDSVDTIHVIEDGTRSEGEPKTIVVHVGWASLDRDGAKAAATVIEPSKDGLYCIGGGFWTWAIVPDGLFVAACNDAHVARQKLIRESIKCVAKLMREAAPEATAITVDLAPAPRLAAVLTNGEELWSASNPDASGLQLDRITVHESESVLRKALSFGRDDADLAAAGWRPRPDRRDWFFIALPGLDGK